MVDLEAGARDIIEARKAVRALEGLPDAHRPRTLAEAYAMQKAIMRQWDDALAGWKVGATSKEVQARFGVTEPAFGPVYAKGAVQSPARLEARQFQHRMLECEFAFRFGASLPPRPAPYKREEVLEAVESLIPSFEIISPRFTKLTADQVPQLVADFFANGGAVLGTPCRTWRDLDLAAHAVTLSIGGKRRQEGTGAIVLGNPLNALEWFVNALSAQGLGVQKGQFVLTGTMTGMHAPELGQAAVGDFGDLGKVEAVFE